MIKNNELYYYYDVYHNWTSSSLGINDICELNVKIKYIKDNSSEMQDILEKIQVKVHSEQAKK